MSLPPAAPTSVTPPVRGRRVIVGLWLALLLLGVWLAARSHYVADLSAFLPAAPTAEQRVLLDQLRNGVTARVVLIGIRGGEPAQRQRASRELAQQLRPGGAAAGQFDAVHNGDQAGWQATGEFLFAHRYLLSPAVDAARFTEAGLREGIADTLAVLGTPAGSLIKPLLWRDPTGETLRMVQAMTPAAAPRNEGGVWVSRSEPRAVLLATTRADGADLDGQAAALQALHAAFVPWAAQGLTLELSGPGQFAVQSRSQIQAEVERLALVGTLVMLLLLWLAFGSLRALGVATLPVASGVLAGIAAVSLGFGTVHGMTLGFGTTLIGEAVDYAIYFLIQSRPVGGGAAAPADPVDPGYRRWLRHHWPTVRLGLWTSLAGFAALAFSGFPGLAQLGVFSLAGLLGAAATTRWLLPVLAPDGSAGQGGLGWRAALGRAGAWLSDRLPGSRGGWLAAVAVAGLWLLLQPSPWRGNLATLSPVAPAALALDASLRADLGAAEAGTLVAVAAPDEATALERAEAAGERLEALVARGLLLGYDSPTRLLPSPRTQRQRLAALPPADALRQRLALAAADGPLRAERLAPFLADVEAQRHLAPVTAAGLAGTPLASLLQAQLVPGVAPAPGRAGRPWTVLLNLQLKAGAPGDHARVVQALRAALADLPETRLVQIQPELDALYGHYLHEALWQAGLGALAVAALLYAHLHGRRRAGRRWLALLLPLAASVLLVTAALAAAGVPLGVLHLVGLLLVVAVGSNYVLFYDHLAHPDEAEAEASAGTGAPAAKRHRDARETQASLLLANITTVVSFGLLATSAVPVLAAIGQVVAPGAALALLLAAAFQPRSPGA